VGNDYLLYGETKVITKYQNGTRTDIGVIYEVQEWRPLSKTRKYDEEPKRLEQWRPFSKIEYFCWPRRIQGFHNRLFDASRPAPIISDITYMDLNEPSKSISKNYFITIDCRRSEVAHNYIVSKQVIFA
jgi:hypothetical protein